MRLCRLSAMYKLPAPSSATLVGRYNPAIQAGPSCTPFHSPLPATETTWPDRSTPIPLVPTPDRYAVPSTLLSAPSSSTAPTCTPGLPGVKVADSVQAFPTAKNVAPEHAPPASAKSSPLAPWVITRTLLTWPAAFDTTVTVIGPEVVPTGIDVGN